MELSLFIFVDFKLLLTTKLTPFKVICVFVLLAGNYQFFTELFEES